jgi:serine protease
MWLAATSAARKKGVTVVVAAGNSGIDLMAGTPANCPGVIRATATNAAGWNWAMTSKDYNYSPTSQLTLSAPGESVLSTFNGNDYQIMSGTSMAAPHVAGVAALVIANRPTLSRLAVEDILRKSVKPYAEAGACNWCGAGITDAATSVGNAAYWPTIAPTAITRSRSGTGTISTTATATANGVAPFYYEWTKVSGSFTISNVNSATVTISEYQEVCGSMPSQVSEGEVSVMVRDSAGRVMLADAPVRLTFSRTFPGTICR